MPSTSVVPTLALLLCSLVSPISSLSVTVFGGGGFTGSRVCKILVDSGAEVTSISRKGVPPKWCAGEDWTKRVDWKAADLLSDDMSSLDQAVGNPDAVVSCVGVIGTDPDLLLAGNGNANVAAFDSARRGGRLRRVAYVSVGSEVDACKNGWLPELFGGYFDGKLMAERAAISAMDGDVTKVCLVKPTFIYGGSDFGLIPPRVNTEYGSGVEELLSLSPLKFLADLSPGLIKVALRPPVSVDSVASACAKAAMDESGTIPHVLDGTMRINEYSGQPKATGLTDALAWGREQAIRFYDWAKVEVPKAIDTVQSKIEETKN
jgi:nucleoside-diphosphate-sugar epimerase